MLSKSFNNIHNENSFNKKKGNNYLFNKYSINSINYNNNNRYYFLNY